LNREVKDLETLDDESLKSLGCESMESLDDECLKAMALKRHNECWDRLKKWREMPLEERLSIKEIISPAPENLERLNDPWELNRVLGIWQEEFEIRAEKPASSVKREPAMCSRNFYMLTLTLISWADLKGMHLPKMWEFLVVTTPGFENIHGSGFDPLARADWSEEIGFLASLTTGELMRMWVRAGIFDQSLIGPVSFMPSLLKSKPKTDAPMSIREIATALDVSERTARKYISSKKIEAVKIDGTHNFSVEIASLERLKKK
jgi:hypothetical protein